IIYSKDSSVKKADVTKYNEFVNRNFSKILIDNLDLTEEQQRLIDSEMVTKFQKEIDAEKDGVKEQEDNQTGNAKYNIIYALLMLVMFTLAFGGERIAMSIITEKASKVMEYLMTSVKPMAIVVGKILANILILFIQVALVILSFALSIVLNSIIFSEGNAKIAMPSFISEIFSMTNFSGLNLVNLLLCILIFIGGFICYGLIAGLAGASVSKMDEIAEGVKMYTMVLIIGAYISIFVVTSRMYDGASAIRYFAMLFPFTSVFITPSAMLTGYVTTVEALISLAILAATIFALIKFVSDVYESMIYYNGTPLKIKDIINISKQNKKGKTNRRKEEE
nr:ABC transporter permease [Lachnospiraceae bacterium]